MNLQGPGLSYILIVIPTLFSLAVVGQGFYKISKKEPDGRVAVGFGTICLILVATAYYFFIR